jgi:hypothetical protein
VPDLSAPITPQEVERVWNSQVRPSARSVAIALTHAGRPVHFTTVARWKRQGLLTTARSSDPRAGRRGVSKLMRAARASPTLRGVSRLFHCFSK